MTHFLFILGAYGIALGGLTLLTVATFWERRKLQRQHAKLQASLQQG